MDQTEIESRDVIRDFKRFEADKMHDTMHKSGEALDKAFIATLSLLGLTGVLVFAHDRIPAQDPLQIPVLGFALRRDDAAAAVLLLACASVYKLFVTLACHEVVSKKFWTVVTQAYECQKLQSSLRVDYPSVVWATIVFLREITQHSRFLWLTAYWLTFGVVFPTIGFVIPSLLLTRVADEYPASIRILLYIAAVTLLLPAVVAHVYFLRFQWVAQRDFVAQNRATSSPNKAVNPRGGSGEF